jgi:DNA-binding CsgD family transcriptional regulator
MTTTDVSSNSPVSSAEAQCALTQEVEATLIPILDKLKQSSTDQAQTFRLINILETNLQHLIKAYGSSVSLAAAYQRLSPVETLVASLVRQGLPTKDIATALSISPGTVSIHRKHIRKKLGLGYKGVNLQSYLQSLN